MPQHHEFKLEEVLEILLLEAVWLVNLVPNADDVVFQVSDCALFILSALVEVADHDKQFCD